MMAAVASETPSPVDYDRGAADYARHRGVHPGVLQAVIEQGELGPATRVLDVGCGTGNYARALVAKTGCRVSGIEPSSEMLRRARAATTWDELVQGTAERLHFPDGTFDLVMSTDVIHHVGDREAYYQEAARVLRPGGQIVTVTDSRQDIADRRPLTSHFPETAEIEMRRYPPIEQLAAEMERAGSIDTRTERVRLTYELTDAQPYRDRAFSSLHMLDESAFARGLERLENDLGRGPLPCVSLYTLLWGTCAGWRRIDGEER